MIRKVSSTSRLSELQELARRAVPRAEVSARMVRSVEQSMRVEGYPVSEAEVRLSAERVLRAAGE
jgi:hypothetical protein